MSDVKHASQDASIAVLLVVLAMVVIAAEESWVKLAGVLVWLAGMWLAARSRRLAGGVLPIVALGIGSVVGLSVLLMPLLILTAVK